MDLGHGIAFEIKKIRWVTIGFAGLSLYRTLSIAAGQFIYNGYSLANEEWIYLLATVGLLVMLLADKKTMAVAFITALLYPKFETVFGSGSVSTALFIYFCFFLGMWRYMVEKYELTKTENHETANRVLNKLYWILFAAYGVINGLSALLHLADPYWQNGYAMEMNLANSYWGRFYYFFRDLRNNHPALMDALMPINNYGVIVSQLLLIPLYVFKPTRKWLSVWFIILLIHIFILLRIVLLPHFTLLFFILICYRKTDSQFGFQLLIPEKTIKPLRNYMLAAYGIFMLLISLKTPGISTATDKAFWFLREWDTRVWFTRRINQMGLGQPDILNAGALQGARRFMIYHKNGSKKEWLPITGKDGERLSYLPDPLFIEHQGLEIIYGNTGAHLVAYDSFTYMNSPTPYKWKGRAVERLIRFDYFAKGYHGEHEYEVEFWERTKPNKNGMPSWDYTDTLTEIRKYAFNEKMEKPLRLPFKR
jgi:hypothetical protein